MEALYLFTEKDIYGRGQCAYKSHQKWAGRILEQHVGNLTDTVQHYTLGH